MRVGSLLRFLLLLSVWGCFISCEEDIPVPLNVSVKTSVEPIVGFELYSSYNTVRPLIMTLISEDEVTASYTWYKVNEASGDSIITTGEKVCRGGQVLLEYAFTEEQFLTDFPQHSMAPQKYRCRTVVSQEGRADLEICDTVEVCATLPQEMMTIWVETDNGKEPTCEYIDAPADAMNSFSITNAITEPGSVRLLYKGETLYDSGKFIADESGMTIKIRGNTSAIKDKKPYKIKLQKKADLLNRGKSFADKDWVLLGTGTDLKTYFGLKVSSIASFSWVPSMAFCNLVVNSEYKGLYILTEQVERDKNCRINVDKDGFLIEYDAYWWNEDISFSNAIYNSKLKWTFKYPSSDDITQDQLNYITDYVRMCEEQVSQQSNYEDYIDVQSFAEWLLVHDILGFSDGAGSNLFFSKNDSGNSLLKMETPWDFDSVFGNLESWSGIHQRAWFWFPDLLSGSNPSFRNAYKATWEIINGHIVTKLWNEVETDIDTAHINHSRKLDGKRWGVENKAIEDEIQESKEWIQKQCKYLNVAIGSL